MSAHARQARRYATVDKLVQSFDGFWTLQGFSKYQERDRGFAQWTKESTGIGPSEAEMQTFKKEVDEWIQKNQPPESADNLTRVVFAAYKKKLDSMFEDDQKVKAAENALN